MNITCIICSDIFTPTSEIYVTPCGHIFHYVCLVQWIERAKTCPQCRNKTTEKTIHRVYFNLPNSDGIVEDASTLQCKLDNLQFQVTLKDTDIKRFKEKYKILKHQNVVLREEIKDLETKEKSNTSVILGLKEKISFLKSKTTENELLRNEVDRLKCIINEYENVQLVINGTKEQVDNLLRENNSAKELAVLVETLKKALCDSNRKKKEIEYASKQTSYELNKYRKQCGDLLRENARLGQELECHKTCEQERLYLKERIKKLKERESEHNEQSTSLHRAIMESPAPLPQKVRFKNILDQTVTEKVHSPSVDERVQMIKDSDSPYLNLKFSGVGLVGNKTKNLTNNKYSIFKSSAPSASSTSSRHLDDNIFYNGLGGHSKLDVFPKAKTSESQPTIGSKRPKSTSTITSAKFRKLAPNKRLDNFMVSSKDEL